MNIVILQGRLTKDPEARFTQSGKSVVTFSLAVDRPFTKDGNREADFINCVAFGKTGELIGNYLSKGRRLLVEGRLQIRPYTDKNGDKRTSTEVIVNSMDFVDSKGKTDKADFSEFEQPQTPPFDEQIPF